MYRSITASALETFFNGVISILAANSFFPQRIHASLDASEISVHGKLRRLRQSEQGEGAGVAQPYRANQKVQREGA